MFSVFGPVRACLCQDSLRIIKVKTSIRRLLVSIRPRVSYTNLTIKYGSKLFKDGTCIETASKRFNGADFRNRTAYVLLRKSVGMSESSKSNERLGRNDA